MKLRNMFAIAALFVASAVHGQKFIDPNNLELGGWHPTNSKPFFFEKFEECRVYRSAEDTKPIKARCNINLAKQELWSEQGGNYIEVDPDSYVRIEFADSSVFYRVVENELAKVVYEDAENGIVAMVRGVDYKKIELMKDDMENAGMVTIEGDQIGAGLALDFSTQYKTLEERLVPIVDKFYFTYHGEVFPVSHNEILKHISPDRKKEFKIFEREAGIVYYELRSVMKIWNDFFVNFQAQAAGKKKK